MNKSCISKSFLGDTTSSIYLMIVDKNEKFTYLLGIILPECHVALNGFGLNLPWMISSRRIFSPLTLGPGSGGVMIMTLRTTIKITNTITRNIL